MLDISAVLRTGDRLTPDTPGCIFIGHTPRASVPPARVSLCLVQIGSSAEAAAVCPPQPPSARLGAICKRPCVFKSAERGPNREKEEQ